MSDVEADCSLLREWLGLAGLEKTAIRDLAAAQLTDQVHARFDAARLDEEAAKLQAEPEWMRMMVGDARWRPLLYELLAAHPQSTLLQAAVRALSQGEHAAEVQSNTKLGAIMGGANSMHAFLSSLAAHLQAMRKGEAGAQARLEGLTCAGEPEFVLAQLLLRAPAMAQSDEYGGLAEQAAATAARAASSARGLAFRRLYLLCAGLPRGSPAMSALISILTADKVSPADAKTLDEQCAARVPLAALRDPTILSHLLNALFDPQRPPKQGPREQLLRVLAAAAADAAADAEGGGEAPKADADADAGGMDLDAALRANGEDPASRRVTERRTAALALLTEAQAICEENEASEIGASVAALRRCAHAEPAAAAGVLIWARRNLTTPQFSGSRFNGSFLPPVLALLSGIAHTHVSLQGEVCAVVHAALMHEPPSDADDVSAVTTVALRKKMLECLLWLLTRGCVFPVLQRLQQWLQEADLSLVRHLMAQLIALAAPPYSAAFGKQLLAMLRAPRTREAHRSAESRAPLRALAEQLARTPGLAEEGEQVLALLQATD